MKILLVNKFFYRRGGSETYFFNLADALINSGNEVIYFSMKDDRNEVCRQSSYFVENIEYNSTQNIFGQVRNGVKMIYSFEARKKFTDLIKNEKPDIVHLNLVHRQITLSIADVCKKYHIPVVHTVHDLICVCPNSIMLSPQGICESCLKGSFLECIRLGCVKGSRLKSLLAVTEAMFCRIHKSYDKIDAYICPSDFTKKKLEEGKFTSRSFVKLRNFLPEGTEYKIRPALRTYPYILYFGRISKEKGLITLVRAFCSYGFALSLHIAGGGPQSEELKRYVSENNYTDRVVFTGYLAGDELKRELAEAKAVIIPSECYENAPYSIMEAQAMGKPVLGADIGGIPELVEDGVNGYIFKSGSADSIWIAMMRLEEMTADEYEVMCQKALEFARKTYDADKYTRKLLALYQKLKQ